jgi:nitrate/nitrite transport system substrate-binding protein
LTGRYADGLGNIKSDPTRIDFDPFPWASMSVWMLTQMRRWGYIKQDVDYKVIAEKIFLVTDARKRMAEMGQAPPRDPYKTFKVMGKEFDANKAAAYAKSFAINKISG